MGLARVAFLPYLVPGGTMNAGPEVLTLEQLGICSAKIRAWKLMKRRLDWANAMHAQAVEHVPLSELHPSCADHAESTWTSRHSTDAGNKP